MKIRRIGQLFLPRKVRYLLLLSINLILSFFTLSACQGQDQPVLEVGNRLQLFVDDWLVDQMDGVRLQLNHPAAREVAIVFDRPWEGNTSGYVTVFQDGDLFRMYYRGTGNSKQQVTCYAESRDGIRFTKPELGLFEFNGSKKNNIVQVGLGTHNFAPMRDANPAASPEAKYKALASGRGGLLAFKSPDAIHWSLMSEKPVITKGAFDSQNLAFWDSVRGRYVDFHRGFRNGHRDIMTCTSADFANWTEPDWLDYPGAPPEHLYTNAVTPYFRAPEIFLGFPKRFLPSRKAATHRFGGVSDGVFMTSRDGRSFHRWGEALIRPGLQQERWVNRNNMTAWGVLETESSIPGVPDELSIYVSEGYYTGTSCQMRRYIFRQDGFVSVNAPMAGGEFRTKVFRFSASNRPRRNQEPMPGPTRYETDKPMFGKRSLKFAGPAILSVPGTKSLGPNVTFAVHVRGIPGGHRRLFSAYNGSSFAPREFFLDVNAAGEIEPGMAIRFGYDGKKVGVPGKAVGAWDALATPDAIHHVAATWQDGQVKIFFDGRQVGEGGAPGAGEFILELGDLRFGEDYPPTSLVNEPFLGTADDILVLRRALGPTEIQAIAEKGVAEVLDLAREDGVLYAMEGENARTLLDSLPRDGQQNTALPGLVLPGEVELALNYSTSAAGSIRCEIQDAAGNPIEGYSLKDCDETYGDHLERPVSWRGNRELKTLVGKPIRLRFVMKDADLYSIRFR